MTVEEIAAHLDVSGAAVLAAGRPAGRVLIDGDRRQPVGGQGIALQIRLVGGVDDVLLVDGLAHPRDPDPVQRSLADLHAGVFAVEPERVNEPAPPLVKVPEPLIAPLAVVLPAPSTVRFCVPPAMSPASVRTPASD